MKNILIHGLGQNHKSWNETIKFLEMMKSMCLLDNEYECVVFYCMRDILERADMENFCFLMLRTWVINRHRMHCLHCISLMLI